MARIVELPHHLSLAAYEEHAHLAGAVQELRAEAAEVVRLLRDRTVWMVNSTPHGGGVAEMLPPMVALLRNLGLQVEWVVLESEEAAFFALTKHLHNLIHGEGPPRLGPEARSLYEAVSRVNAGALRERVRPDDILVVHDPQPLAMGAMLRAETGARLIWRCHIGLDESTPATRAAWGFLEPYAAACDRAVFSAPEYIPSYLTGRAAIVHPAIDPLSHKNRELSIHKLVGILSDARLIPPYQPVLAPPFPFPARRFGEDGRWAPADRPEDIGLLHRPIVTQISRWDELKGFRPLMEGFVRLKEGDSLPPPRDARHRRTREAVRLVLAGPDPGSIVDDPEAVAVLAELQAAYCALPAPVRREIALLSLPMASRKENALMVNSLQRCSTIVAQNSLREGFGLTATEAMWKRVPVLGTRAVGLRRQVRDGLDGRLVADPRDPEEIARTLDAMLADPRALEAWGRTAQRRVHTEFLVFHQLQRWLELLAETG